MTGKNSKSDPAGAARSNMKRALPKRFYRQVSVVEQDGAFAIALDGRVARTPLRAALAVPSQALASALAQEWMVQGEHIDPVQMPLTRIINSALDGVAREREGVVAEIVRYAGSDLLCYRAAEPSTLARRQTEAWDPLLEWATLLLGVRLKVGTGMTFIQQSPQAMATIEAVLKPLDAIQLAALHVMTTLTGSAILGLAVLDGALEPEAAWAAAHVDDDYQSDIWGMDEEARLRRAARWQDMDAAARVLSLHDIKS